MSWKRKTGNMIVAGLIIICLIVFFCIKKQGLKEEGKAVNAFCGEWEVVVSQSVEGGQGCIEEGEIIAVYENEIEIGDEVISNISYDGTLTENLRGKEYNILFQEYGYDCPFFEEEPKEDYFLYVTVSNSEKQFGFCMAEKDELVIRYGDSVYYCERISEEENGFFQEFAGLCRVHDWGLDGGEVYEGEWLIKNIAAVIDESLADENMTGKSIYFYRPDLGKIRIFYDGKMYRKIEVKMDIISKNQKSANQKEWDEMGLSAELIPFVQFHLEDTDISQLQGIYVINSGKILMVTKRAIYTCVRSD